MVFMKSWTKLKTDKDLFSMMGTVLSIDNLARGSLEFVGGPFRFNLAESLRWHIECSIEFTG